MKTSFELHYPLVESATAINILHQLLGTEHNGYCENALTKADIKQAIDKGALWLTRGKHTQRLRRVKKILPQGDELHFYYNTEVLSAITPTAQLIADKGAYSIWFKPYGMLSQGSKWSDHCTIARFAEKHFNSQRPVFIVHRLDRAATGLIVIAHSKKIANAFSTLFEQRSLTTKTKQLNNETIKVGSTENAVNIKRIDVQEISLEKYYRIIVHGDHRSHPQPEIITTDVDGKSALSQFSCIEYSPQSNQSLIEVKIESGRKHQIRVHAASVGLPVVGDRLYGDHRSNEHLKNENLKNEHLTNKHLKNEHLSSDDLTKEKQQPDLQLCAISLAFECPISHQLISIQLPEPLMPSLPKNEGNNQ